MNEDARYKTLAPALCSAPTLVPYVYVHVHVHGGVDASRVST